MRDLFRDAYFNLTSLVQVMREASYGRAHKTIVRKRMDEVLLQLILPTHPPPEPTTHFTVQEDESFASIVDQLRRDCPRWCKNRTKLLDRVAALLEAGEKP